MDILYRPGRGRLHTYAAIGKANLTRDARYQQVRNRKDQERTDETTLSFELRAFRRMIEKEPMIRSAGWNYEVKHYEDGLETPLWFDARIVVKASRSRGKTALIDLMRYKTTDTISRRRRQRKLDYTRERGIPYLELTLDQLSTRLRVFCVKVRAGDV